MLSFTRGKEIGKFTEGKMKGKYIRLYGENDFGDLGKPDIIINKADSSDLLDNDFYKEQNITPAKKRQFNQILNGKLKLDDKDMSELLKEQLEEAKKQIEETLKKRILFDDPSTKIFPVPQKESERIYVPAPSGSGKSTFIGEYLNFIREKYGKKRKIYIFSRVDEDKPLDKHKNVIRIPLEEDWFKTKPLNIDDFKDGILIFDDIDTIMNKSVVRYVRNFRDDVLETGRHYNMTVISTSHLIANFLATRTLINEANAIVLFPRGSSFSAISNFLDRYMGFTKKQIRYVEKLPTRWIWFWKEYPKYAIHEKGAFIY